MANTPFKMKGSPYKHHKKDKDGKTIVHPLKPSIVTVIKKIRNLFKKK